MAKYAVGEYIYEVRKRRGYTQEELAEGICTTGTLSKIENGSRVPSASTYEALMQRLGEPASLFSVYLGQKELEADNFCRRILRILARNEVENPYLMMEEYGAALIKYHLKESQIMLCMKAICHAMMLEPPEKVLEELFAALRVTEPESFEAWLGDRRRFLTFDEIVIWNNIAIQYKHMEQMGKALNIWQTLREYLSEREVDEEEKAKIYPVILYNLAGICSQGNLHAEAVWHSEEGIQSCVEFGKLFPLPYLLHRKGQELLALGESHAAEEYFRKSEMLLEILKKKPEKMIEEMTAAF